LTERAYRVNAANRRKSAISEWISMRFEVFDARRRRLDVRLVNKGATVAGMRRSSADIRKIGENRKKFVSRPFLDGFRRGLKRSILLDVGQPPHPSLTDSDHAECGGVSITI
jgi:hypothetical protein